jgi:hypothetical protein
MSQYRTLQYNNKQYIASDYINKKKNIETLKFAHSITNNNKETNSFYLKCQLEKKITKIQNDKIVNCDYSYDISHIIQPTPYIAFFNNYNMMINLLKEQASLDNNCYKCKSVPITLDEALASEFEYNNNFKILNSINNHPCKSSILKYEEQCKLFSKKLYPYGEFNNNNPDINISLRRKLLLNCDNKKPCPTKIYCKCSSKDNNCNCCEYIVTFPFKDTFLSYTVSKYTNEYLYNLIKNPGKNPNKNYNNYKEKLNNNIKIKNLSILSFGLN